MPNKVDLDSLKRRYLPAGEYVPMRGEDFAALLLHIRDLEVENIALRNSGSAHHAALQRVGTALGLLAGADLHRECVPAIEALMDRASAQQAEPSAWYDRETERIKLLGDGEMPPDGDAVVPLYEAPQAAPASVQQAEPVAVELRAVAETVAKSGGFWRTCSGCYDTEDGRPTQKYAYSDVFGCALGNGCSDCGGLGAVWDDTDYDAMAEDMEETDDAIAAPAPSASPAALTGDARWRLGFVATGLNRSTSPIDRKAGKALLALLAAPPEPRHWVASGGESKPADAAAVADALEVEYLAVANGEKKPAKMALEPLARAVQTIRALAAPAPSASPEKVTHEWDEWVGAEDGAWAKKRGKPWWSDGKQPNYVRNVVELYVTGGASPAALTDEQINDLGIRSGLMLDGKGFVWAEELNARDMRAAIRALLSEVAPNNDALQFVGLSVELLKALKRLSFAAQTTGGVAGRDDELVAAISEAETAIQFASGRVAAKHISDGRANRLEQDAKRYRWIRRDRTSREDRVIIDILVDTCEEYFDAAIDAAMSASKEGA